MHQTIATPLREVDFDPQTFTSFGAPPPNPEDIATNNGSRIGSLFGAVASAFRRGEQPTYVKPDFTEKPQSLVPDSKLQLRDHSDSVSSNPESQQPPAVPHNSSGSQPQKKISSIFKKNPPVAIGLNTKWASDDTCYHCYACSTKFTTFNRRHHCRFCGRIFCDSCSSFRIPGQPFGSKDGLRSCEVCYRETLRSLLETHFESLSEDVLQKVASLYAVVAGSGSGHNQSFNQNAQPISTPTVTSSAQTSGNISSHNRNVGRAVITPRVLNAELSEESAPALTNIIPPSPSNSTSIIAEESASVISDPLRRMAIRRTTMDDINDASYGSDDEEQFANPNYRTNSPQSMPQFSHLKQIFESALHPNSGLKFETRRSLAKTFYHCFSGENLLKWLMIRDQELNSFQAAAIAKAMLDLGIIVPLQKSLNTEVFALSSYYRPGRAAGFVPINPTDQKVDNTQSKHNSNGTKSSNPPPVAQNRRPTGSSSNIPNPRTSSFGVASVATAPKTNQMNVLLDAAVGESLQKNFLIKERPNEILPYRASDVEASIRRLYKIHLARLCSNLLAIDELNAEKWQKNILQIVYQVVRIVKPRPRDYSDALDIRRCVKIKKMYDSTLSAHFEYVDGLVFTKSLAHRTMRSSLHNPKFLLVGSGLDFERDSQQLTTLDVVVHQEAEQMLRTVSQLATVRPTVLFCAGSIPIIACEHLVANDITAASYVKPHILEQIARYTGAAILPSVDSLSIQSGHSSHIRLGTCRTFASFSVHMHTRLQKTFLCLSGCDPIGCTLLIRDSDYSDLIKVKRILKLLILAAYDGLVLSNYLITFRANPRSFELDPPYNQADDKLSNRFSGVEDDEAPAVPSTRRQGGGALKRSKSASRDPVAAAKRQQRCDSSLAALDLSVSPAAKSSSLQDSAFALALSGLLSLSPLVKLPDPLKKSSVFEASDSRIYFESSLFSLFGSSFKQGRLPLALSNPGPPVWLSKSVVKPQDPFVTTPLVGDFKSVEIQTLLTRFRREGFLFEISEGPNPQLPVVASELKRSSSGEKPDGKCGAWVKPLSIFECQCLHVLTSTFSLDSQLSPFRHCDGPRLVSCPFHARCDLSLGAFLENQCFVPTTVCPRRGCGAPLIDHVRRFTANGGRVEIVVRPLAEPILSILSLADPRMSQTSIDSTENSTTAFSPDALITWAMCRSCRSVTPFSEVTEDVWGMPLACYLHLKFYSAPFKCVPATRDGSSCNHHFNKDYLQFFAKESLVAVVKYNEINVSSLVIPPRTFSLELSSKSDFNDRHSALLKDHETVTQAILTHFDTVQAYLENCKSNLLYSPGSNLVSQPALDLMTHSEEHLADERKLFITNMAALELAITDPAWEERPDTTTIVQTTDRIVYELFQNLNQSWLDWNERLKNLVRFLRTHSTSSVLSNADTDNLAVAQATPIANSVAAATSPIAIAAADQPFQNVITGASISKDFVVMHDHTPDQMSSQSALGRPSSTASILPPQAPTKLGKSVLEKLEFLTDAEVFKQPIFKTKLKLPLKSPLDTTCHYVFRNQTCLFPVVVYDNEPSSLIAFALSSDEYNQKLKMLAAQKAMPDEAQSPLLPISRTVNADFVAGDKPALESDISPEEGAKALALTGSEGDMSSDDDDMIRESVVNIDDGSMTNEMLAIENEEDDTSQVEFGSTLDPVDTISIRGVMPKMASRRPILDSARFVAPRSNSGSRSGSLQSSPQLRRKGKSPQPAATPLMSGQPAIPKDSPGVRSPLPQQQQQLPMPVDVDPHIRISWTDAAVSKDSVTKFSVTIYHAAIFAEIRSILIEKSKSEENDLRNCLETSFLQSLTRCISWVAAGGKSGLRFYKTTDGRLILKQVSKDELKTIFKLAPDYAALISSARELNRPSALVPILGAFNVSFDNGSTGKSSKFDLIVMTNLFRDFVISDKFDLKGSERNRFVKQNHHQNQQESSENEAAPNGSNQPYEMVLMDENLLIRSLQDPLYVHPHSKQLLLQAISADTLFLARNSVMDYSLLVGIDAERRCIVVGIIDYLRTFTFDKKLEYVVKSAGLLGGQGKAPTILYPGKYRDRFLSAMRHFFLEVPDHWLAYETHNLRLGSQN